MFTKILGAQGTTAVSYLAFLGAYAVVARVQSPVPTRVIENDKLLSLADRFPAPQSWYDEDFDGLF